MPYIYKITNDINNKVYIGKTLESIEKRWKEHQRDAQKVENQNRPLYKAISKYGIKHFSITQLEKCQVNNINDRERYWIQFYGSFKYGYNATLGGDGKHYADYDLIYSLYNQGKTIKEICDITKYSNLTCRVALENFGICSAERKRRGWDKLYHTVAKLDKDSFEILEVYPSIKAAYASLGKEHSGHIAAVCNGKRKTAYGYSWKYI